MMLFIDSWGWVVIHNRREPRISFTDLTSMVVMEERGITDILTEDTHFAQVGMGFRILPWRAR